MVIRRFLFSWVCLLASSLFMYGQVAVKTNVAIDAVAIPNLGVEVGLSKKLTVDIPFYYNPWKYSDNKMLKLVMVQPELRYWLCDKFNGHFFGFHLMGGAYNTTGIDLPFSPFDDLKDFRYKGHFYGGGVSYGYQFVLGRHWNLGATIGGMIRNGEGILVTGDTQIRPGDHVVVFCLSMMIKKIEKFFN